MKKITFWCGCLMGIWTSQVSGQTMPCFGVNRAQIGTQASACRGIEKIEFTSANGTAELVSLFKADEGQGGGVEEDVLPSTIVVDDGVNGPVTVNTSCTVPIEIGDVFGPYMVTDIERDFDSKFAEHGNEIEISGSFAPGVAIDLTVDDVTYKIVDAAGHTVTFLIPAGSFQVDGDPTEHEFKFKGIVEGIEIKARLETCKFKISASGAPGTALLDGSVMTFRLQIGSNVAQNILPMENKHNHLKFKRTFKVDCCPDCVGIASMQVTSDQGVLVFTPAAGNSKLSPTTVVDDGVNGSVTIDTSCEMPIAVGDVFGPYTISALIKIFEQADTLPPTAIWVNPNDGAFLNGDTIAAELHLIDDQSGLDPLSLHIFLDGAPVNSAFSPLTPGLQGTLRADLVLSEGPHTLFVRARDLAGHLATASVSFTVDRTPPALSQLLPINGDILSDPNASLTAVFGDLLGAIDAASVMLFLNGTDVTSSAVFDATSLSFIPDAPLAEGQYVLSLVLQDQAGNVLAAETRFTIEIPPPPAPILDPHDTMAATPSVIISGFAPDAVSVEVFGPSGSIEVPVAANLFSADVALLPNRVNRVIFTSIGSSGKRSAPVSTAITQDLQPPSLFIDFPTADSTITAATVDVGGRVGDMLSGFMGLTVMVNGVAAVVDVGIGTNGTFLASPVPLALGPNTITASATDVLGNTITRLVTVTHADIPPDTAQMAVISGNFQTAQINTLLALPITVGVTHGDGTPFTDKIVTFDVTRSNGRLTADSTGEGAMRFQRRSDANGLVHAFWRLGTDAGCGNNRVAVTSKDIAGTILFCASATHAPAFQISLGSGNNQRVEAGGPALEPLRVWVSDGRNGVPNIPVAFAVASGGGLVDGLDMTTVMTSETGHAEVGFTLGADAGINEVTATFAGNTGSPAVFVATGVSRVQDQSTAFSGIVLDDAGRAIGGATCSLNIGANPTLTTTTNARGRFRFSDLAFSGVGSIRVNGLTATSFGESSTPAGSFPSLHFDVVVIPNAENSLSSPILLPPLDPVNARAYDGTQDVALAVEGLEGLKMLVKAGSMRNADGTVPTPQNPAIISVNAVHFDDSPMPFPNGASPLYAGTLQPSGATFDPPVQVEIPNTDGLPAGSTMNLMLLNSSTSMFEIIGTGHVTDDGLMVVSDPGSGFPHGGWHSQCPPYPFTGGGGGTGGGGNGGEGGGSGGCKPGPCENPGKTGGSASPDANPYQCTDPSESDGDPGDPIYLFSGEFYEDVVDLKIKGRGLDFIWSRKYTSKRTVNSAQGNGWDCSYNIFLEQDNGGIILNDGHARRDQYKEQPDGIFSKPGFYREFRKNLDGTITLEFAAKGQWIFFGFDGSLIQGKIKQIIDRNGNSLTFNYDIRGRLKTIHDTLETPTNSRTIAIAYNADDFIQSISDFAGRQIIYGYYQDGDIGGSFGDLKFVRTQTVNGTPNGNDFPNGKTTVYTYTAGFVDERLNHNLLTITDAKGQTYLQNIYAHTVDPTDARFTFDPSNINFDRVVRQIWGNPDEIIDIFYTRVTPTAANNGAVVKAIFNDRVGNVSEHFYDTVNRRVIKREFTGRANPDLLTTEMDNRPLTQLRPDDPPFFETKYFYNIDSRLVRTEFPNGNVVSSIYEADINSLATPRTRGNVRMRIRTPGTHAPPGDQPIIVETFKYDTDFSGCCGFNFETEHVDGRGNITLKNYDAFGNLIHTQERIASVVDDYEYNAFGQMTAHVLPDNGSNHRRRDEYTYYTAGHQFGYMEKGIVDAPGFALTTTYEYDLVGNVIRRTDPRGHDTQYIVNELDQVVRRISREVTPGSGVRYQRDTFYDANDNVVRMDIQNIDETGAVLPNTHFSNVYEYEILNYRTRMCEEVGNFTGVIPGTNQLPTCTGLPNADFLSTEYAYDANRNRTLMRYGEAIEGRQPDNLTQTLYDERDLPFREIRAPGTADQSTTQYDYDRNENLRATRQGIEDHPRVTSHIYDGYNRVVSSADPMGNQTVYQYDPNSNLVTRFFVGDLVDVPGNFGNARLTETAYIYDPLDRQVRADEQFFDTQTQAPIGDGLSITQTFYSDNSQVLRGVNDNGHVTLITYDTANRRSVTTDAKNNTMVYAYDSNNNVVGISTTEKSDLGNPDELFTTSFTYDGLDRRISMTDNVGNTGTYLYDSRNNQTKKVDALGNVVRNVYDGINRLTSSVRELRSTGNGTGTLVGHITTTQTWDDSNRLTGQGDDNGNVTRYIFDPLNRKTAEPYADGTVHSYVYDVHDNRVQMTDPNGSVTDCLYDLLNRQTRKDIVPGPGVSNDTTFEVFKYDGLSRLIHAEDDDSLVTRSYNSRSNITRETLNGQSTFSVYDGVSNMTQCTYPGGRVVSCTFDKLERKKDITDQVTGLVASYDYVGPARVTRKEYGNSTRTDYAYDGITGIANPANDFAVKKIIGTRHTRIADGSVIDDRTYTWDKLYNKTERKDVRAGGPQLTHDYSYDSIYRLIHTNVTDGVGAVVRDTVYNLDGVGNRTSVAGTPNPGSYTMDVTGPEPADRQMNQYTSTSFDARQYDKNGNLSAIDAAQPAARSIVYDYRNRMVRHIDAGNGTTATYKYDALNRRIERIVDDGVPVTTRYFYNAWQVCEEQNQASSTQATYVYGRYIDEVLNMRRGSSDFFYHCDELYNVMGMTDSAGAVVERYEYGDYGSPSVFDALGNPLTKSRFGNSYLFTGRRFDLETRWYYYRTRYLNAIVGRFTTRDTIGIWGDTYNLGNGYSYVGDNPYTYSDPSGQGFYTCLAAAELWQATAIVTVGVCIAALFPEPGEPVIMVGCLMAVAGSLAAVPAVIAACTPVGTCEQQRRMQEKTDSINALKKELRDFYGAPNPKPKPTPPGGAGP